MPRTGNAGFASCMTRLARIRRRKHRRRRRLSRRMLQGLNVVSQEVVNIHTGPRDGRRLAKTSMGTVPVVLVIPGSKLSGSFGRVLVETKVGPFAGGGLDEALGFAVGAGRVEASAAGLDVQALARVNEESRAEAGAVVGEDGADGDPEAGEVSNGLLEELAGGEGAFIGKHSRESNARVIVDSDVQEFPTGAAGFVERIAGDAMARFDDAGQLFDVDVQQIAGRRMFIAEDRYARFEHPSFVEMEASKNAADGGAAQAGRLSDADTGPTLTTELLDESGLIGRDASGRVTRLGRMIVQGRNAAATETAHPLAGGLAADPEQGRGLVQGQPVLYHAGGERHSTLKGQARIMVNVHSVSWKRCEFATSASQFSAEWTTTS